MANLNEMIFGQQQAPNGKDEETETLRLGRVMQDLVATEAWKEFEEILMKRQHLHVQELMKPLQTDAQVYVQETNKGAIHALAWASGLPSAIIAESKNIIERRKAGTGKDTKHAPLAP